MKLDIIILAAGQGKRMHSDVPKVLHKVAGKPMLLHVIERARELSPQTIHVVIGHGAEQVKAAVDDDSIRWRVQDRQHGTGHAVQQAAPGLQNDHNVLILYGDVPLLAHTTLQSLIRGLSRYELVLLSARFEESADYGRIVRDVRGRVLRIVEQRDADRSTRAINEMNTGVLATKAGLLKQWLARIKNDNAQQEYYLTDCIGLAVESGHRVEALVCEDASEVLGINDKSQLVQAERIFQRRAAQRLMGQGVTVMDPDRMDVRGELEVGRDVEIDINTIFEGTNRLGDRVRVGANTVLINSSVGAGTRIHPNSHIENAVIGCECELGPFARIRPETRLADQVKVGNFVEIKKSDIKTGSKINHLSYIGDADLGEQVNVGAGVITCNYDGARKHRTVIGDHVFVGSDTQLVAPVVIGDGATIGAGSTITKDAPGGELTVARSRQVTTKNWNRPEKNKK